MGGILGMAATLASGLLLGLVPSTVAAQDRPGGSYLSSCNSAVYADGVLIATCRMPDGSTRSTALPGAAKCTNGVKNNNGRLECEVASSPPPPSPPPSILPGGSYDASCTSLRMTDGVLTGQCRQSDGTMRVTSLADALSCIGGVDNLSGQLACADVRNAKFESTCAGSGQFVIRIAGRPSNLIAFILEYGQKVHFGLPAGSTFAAACNGVDQNRGAYMPVGFE